MNKEAIKTFSYRISQANRTELVVITMDMGIQYIEDAINNDDVADYKENLRMAKRVVDELIAALDMNYDISRELFNVYMVIERYLIKAGSGATEEDYHSDERELLLNTSISMLGKLRESFHQLAKQDESEALMQNTQQVYAGLTYSSMGGESETYNTGANRGFRV